MANGFIKKTTQSAKDTAVKMARQAAREPVEIIGHSKSQITGADVHKTPLVEEIVKGSNASPAPTQAEQEQIQAQAKKRIQELEEEIQRMRNKREAQGQEWQKQQESLMGVGVAKPAEKGPLVQPVSKRKTGMQGPGQKKQGTKEMGKQISG